MKILVLNLGSTSTKVGVFEGTIRLCEHTIRHEREELMVFGSILKQKAYRKAKLLEWLNEKNYNIGQFRIIVARGGIIRPVAGGVFLIDQAAAQDAESGNFGMHPANVGMLIAREWSLEFEIPAVFVDAIVTDELSEIARVSGYKGVTRRSSFHALNMKRVIRLYCQEQTMDPYDSSFVVAHMGGGITVGAFHNFRAIDVTNGADGEGPFTPERTGSLTTRALLELVGNYGGDTIRLYEELYRNGGLQSYFGTNNVPLLINRIEKEPEVRTVLDAMIYGIAKHIAAMAAVLNGQVNRILLTGGIAYSKELITSLLSRVDWIAGCTVYPGEDELTALAEGANRYLMGIVEAQSIEGK